MKKKSPLKSKTNWLQAINAALGVLVAADPALVNAVLGERGLGLYLIGAAVMQAFLRSLTDSQLRMRP